MGNLVFLRHGRAKNNEERILAGRMPGVPLTERGLQQAGQAAEIAAGLGCLAVYSSPVQRARDTARIVAERCGVDMVLDERLTELDMGQFTGKGYDHVVSEYGNMFLKFYEGDPLVERYGVETFEHVKARILDAARSAVDRHGDGNVILVTHMDPIKALVSETIGAPPAALSELVIANASLNLFREYGGRLFLSALNVMGPARYAEAW